MQHFEIPLIAATVALFLAIAVFDGNWLAFIFAGVYWAMMFDWVRFLIRSRELRKERSLCASKW